MRNRSPHELVPGMLLAEAAFNLDGKLLFPAGTELTEKQIEILMMWGTENVCVEGTADPEEAITTRTFSDSIKSGAEAAIQKRFKLVKSSHPVVVAMREIAILELAKSSDNPKAHS